MRAYVETHTFQFRPNEHWNVVPEKVFRRLLKFYGADRLRKLVTRE